MWVSLVRRPVMNMRWAPRFMALDPSTAMARLYCLQSRGVPPSPSLAELSCPERDFLQKFGFAGSELAAWKGLARGSVAAAKKRAADRNEGSS